MRQLIAGNWKMNGLSADGAALAAAIAAGSQSLACDILVCPPFTLLTRVHDILQHSPVALGGQDCHKLSYGAHTGDISAEMLADAGCKSVILGHSERRQTHGETDAEVHDKVLAAAHAGLRPIVCVGETEAERDAGQETAIVGRQIAASLPDGFDGAVAYEPIWAIGTGRTPSLAEIDAVHSHIRDALVQRLGAGGGAIRILYGGSVKPENAAEILAIRDVGGALIGGASLQAESFLAIARCASTLA